MLVIITHVIFVFGCYMHMFTKYQNQYVVLGIHVHVYSLLLSMCVFVHIIIIKYYMYMHVYCSLTFMYTHANRQK